MTNNRHTRLSKESSSHIKDASKIYFVRYERENLTLKTVVLVFLNEDMFIVAQDGDMGYWNADDVVKAKRSIKRLNPTCDIFDRRDYIIKYEDRQKSNYYNKILSDLTLNKTEIAAPEAIQVVQRLDQTISKLEKQAENMFADRANSNDIKELYENIQI
ncbi:hypothetical protein [Acinetobacter baumannii]|uniref:hypothetical protein n=1 Tax=Acinetobacter baumannii TaxID=470 RepID=UPI003736E36A